MEITVRPAQQSSRRPYALLDKPHLMLPNADRQELQIEFSDSVWDAELFAVIDIYSAANPVHPGGHVGWWKYPLDERGNLEVTVVKTADGFSVLFNGQPAAQSWVNEAYSGLDDPVLNVHVVLRDVASEAIEFEDKIHLYQAAPALSAHQAQQRALLSVMRPLSAPWYVWPGATKVHIVATSIFERDAVGNFAIGMWQLLRASGIECQLYATQFETGLRGTIFHTCELMDATTDDDLVLLHLSIVDPWVPEIARLPARKLLYFHNITPPRFFQVYDAEYAAHCSKGVEQIVYAKAFDVLLANSHSSAAVLKNLMHSHRQQLLEDAAAPDHHANGDHANGTHVNGNGRIKGPFEDASRLLERAARMLDGPAQPDVPVHVCPPMIRAIRQQPQSGELPESALELSARQTRLLYVGRIAPHKRIEDLLALFAEYRKLDPDSALLLVGGASFSGYSGYLKYLVNNQFGHLKDDIHFYDAVDQQQLETLYDHSTAMVTMSQHEGFCVPVVEAMLHDLPVFAFAHEAIRETLGNSGRMFFEKDFAAIAKDIHDVLFTPWKRELIVAQQRRRAAELTAAADGREVWAALEKGIVARARAV